VKLLVLGKDGQVGRALQNSLPALGDVVALGRTEADLEHPKDIGALIASERPDVIVNAAAYTAVDAAEDDRQRAWTINAEALEAIGAAAKQNGALVVHYSTDYVYPGNGDGFQSETEHTSAASVYGASKLAGEVLLRDSGAAYVILRTSWVYAPRGKNFPLTILRLAAERESLTVVVDQIGAPTPADLIADVTARLIPQVVADTGKHGTYNLAPSGETSWHGLAQLLIAEALVAGAKLKLTPDSIQPIPANQYPAKAARPANSRLDTSKLRASFGIDLPPWQEGVRRLIRTLQTEGRL
jgi:dTDP-4-dehydrorhamnose reductase